MTRGIFIEQNRTFAEAVDGIAQGLKPGSFPPPEATEHKAFLTHEITARKAFADSRGDDRSGYQIPARSARRGEPG
jgi:hypothetical protein